MKTLFDFLTLSPRQISKLFKDKGVTSHKDIPKSKEELCKLFGIENDDRVQYYHAITRTGQWVEWHVHLNIDLGEYLGVTKLECEFYVDKKAGVLYNAIGGLFTNVQIYDKECPLFDARPTYNNLEFTLNGHEYVDGTRDKYKDRFAPKFDDNKPLAEYINIIKEKANNYVGYLKAVEEICFNGELVTSYNKYALNKFRVGREIITLGVPCFSKLVRCYKNLTEKYGITPNLDGIMALYQHMSFDNTLTYRDDIVRLFRDDDSERPTTKDDVVAWIDLAVKARLIRSDFVSWEQDVSALNKEYHFKAKALKEELAKKYNIPCDFIFENHYNEQRDAYLGPIPQVPEHLKAKYSPA